MQHLTIVSESTAVPFRCRGLLWKAMCVFLSMVVLYGCGRGEVSMEPQNSLISSTLSEVQLKKVRTMRILFGHQSVGNNLIEGINDLAGNNPAARLNIVETGTPGGQSVPVFAHFPVGSNTQPDSKMASFSEHVSKSGNSVDVACFKFCYVDTGTGTDVEGLFNRYKIMMAEMKKRFPDVAFVHITIPLTSLETGLKGYVKKLLGKSVEEEANTVRTRYNMLLRKEFAGREPLFDLAAVESTAPDGSRLQGQKDGVIYEALCPQYTYDGGHLNELGRKRCALEFLRTLASVGETGRVKKQ